MNKKIKKLVKDLLSKLEVEPEKINLKKDNTDTYHLDLKLSGQDGGVLIGYHGDIITALQLILGLILYKKQGSWTRLVVNINDYRQKRSEDLKKTADDTVKRVKFSSQPIALFNLNPYERRIIHLYLKDHPDVNTDSEGQGKNRRLIVSLK